MKNYFINLKYLLIGGLIIFSACEKKIEWIAPFDTTGANSNFAHIRFVHASPNLATLAGTTTDQVNLWLGSEKINGVRLGYAGLFPSNFPTTYAAVPAGPNQRIRLSLQGTGTNIDSTEIFSMTQNLEAGKFYSFIASDKVTSASDSNRIFVEDVFDTPNEGRVILRFANVLNDTATDKRVELFSTRRSAVLFSNVQENTITTFTNLPFLNIPDTLLVRRTANPSEIVARINGITFSNRRVYTIFARGNTELATGAKAKALTWYTNR